MHVAVKNQKYSMIKTVQTDLCKGQIKASYKGQGGKDTHNLHPQWLLVCLETFNKAITDKELGKCFLLERR